MAINPQYQRLEKAAKDNNFTTVAGLFKKIGITKTTAYYIRDSKQQLSMKIAKKIGDLLGNVSPEWLLTGKGNEEIAETKANVCSSCVEKQKVIDDLRELNEFIREKYNQVKQELDELKLNKVEKSRKTA